jgi:hypothetical protein
VHDGLVVELHLVSDDPQLDDIRRGSPAVIEVDEVLASAPSHWIDPSDATHADQFYRCAALRSGSATETTTDPAAVVTSRASCGDTSRRAGMPCVIGQRSVSPADGATDHRSRSRHVNAFQVQARAAHRP